ncbi:molybdopterin-binding protein, partial [Pelagibacteraceae bacterium]|nr:molybdopterin-binding protein [Pelagibacteraceae bacterium]
MPIDTSLDFVPINIAVITISDSRTKENDTSGDTLENRITEAGHTMIKRIIIPDDVSQIKDTLDVMSKEEDIDCIITTGGTGLTGRDTTPEAVKAIASKHIDGFGELFRQVSFEKIGTSAIQSRAVAALIN